MNDDDHIGQRGRVNNVRFDPRWRLERRYLGRWEFGRHMVHRESLLLCAYLLAKVKRRWKNNINRKRRDVSSAVLLQKSMAGINNP